MGRSLKKGPYIDDKLMGRVEELNRTRQKKVLKTWSRRSTTTLGSLMRRLLPAPRRGGTAAG